MKSITDKELDRARKAAIRRMRKGIDKAIVNCATGTVLTHEGIVADHINREQGRLARLWTIQECWTPSTSH